MASGAIKAFPLLWLLCGFTQGVKAHSRMSSAFTDLELNQWLAEHPKGLIFLISEGMPYSIRNLIEIENSARKHALPLLVLSDQCPEHPIRAKEAGRSCTTLASDTLIRRGALRHFPSLFFNRNHTLSKRVIPGFQTHQELERALKENLSEDPDVFP